ncbi:MAG: HAMP domain-containing sensor histidine kinase [Pigmentiphaga sp.]|uniref:HAMP domain-containing sensor histidine kinase n=1 Tax=Pigmentiphaga sp. TaxID=1977564 RepID=UPI0029AE95AC|nr:HAMP domain-containing sensor histidine kinase [Pigmentiphaga sp.]MDX3906628.1 HAMP domain-containing sensor histidine kinase [Pigmentiphaga sp.]
MSATPRPPGGQPSAHGPEAPAPQGRGPARWAARLVPRSLRARLILLILGSVLVAQAATFLAIAHYRRNLLENVAPDLMATTIRTLRASIAQIDENERAAFVAAASQGEWRLVSRPVPPRPRSANERRMRDTHPPRPRFDPLPGGRMPPGFHPGEHRFGPERRGPREAPRWAEDDPRPAMRGLIHRLNTQLADGTRVALSRGPEPALFISLSPAIGNDDEPVMRSWLVISLERISPPVRTPLIVMWLGGLGAILLIAAGFSWHITRPITSLAHAADRLAAGTPERVEPAGPHETRVLGERFNAMLDALNEADRVRRTLLAGLPHDLKGPLARMRLRTEMVDDTALKEGLRQDAQDMQHIVDQFINFVRGTDRATYHFTPIDLGDWLRERIHAWQGTGSQVRYASPPEQELIVQADAVALARLVDNLIENAMQHGAPPVEISLEARAGQALLAVRDHGPGISPERHADAFRPFSRLDPARSRSGNVGLGLALVDAIARAHGGRVDLEAPPGGGLKVVVAIPLLRAMPQEA